MFRGIGSVTLGVVVAPAFILGAPAHAEITCFTHQRIATLPGTEWGTAGPAVGDFDRDGDLDVAVARREPAILHWYETRPDGKAWTWVPHVAAGEGVPRSLGSAVLDLNGDEWPDVVLQTAWYENPGTLARDPDAAWTAHPYGGGGHDITVVDVDGDGRDDLLVSNDDSVRWYRGTPELEETTIAAGLKLHGATAPRGYGDLDGDGDPDVVTTGDWFENPGPAGGAWVRHAWPHLGVPNASYGPSMRSWITDLDRDGRQDILYSDCDTGYGHVYWVENLGEGGWTRHALADPPGSPDTGSFHSLGVADFDGDGDLDVFAGEQEDPDTYMVDDGLVPMKPPGLKERGVIWENVGTVSAPRFEPRVIHEGRPGWHDAVLVDFDGDGDTDLVSKVWHTGGKPYHLDLWRNDNEKGCTAGRTRAGGRTE